MMQIFAERETKRFLTALAAVLLALFCIAEGFVFWQSGGFSAPLAGLFGLLAVGIGGVCRGYFARRETILNDAGARVRAFLDGDDTARLACNEEGALYRLFQAVNTLAAVLAAQAANEQRDREFLKNTISDISHQLKTPLAALNIYNGLLQDTADPAEVQQFAALSEQELDRMEELVQNLLKITRLDAGAIVLEKTPQPLAALLADVQQRFACRAQQEGKTLQLADPAAVQNAALLCDRVWLLEALGNLVKNALDHTDAGDTITLQAACTPMGVQLTVQDTGSGIHPEDLPHIFKRFYRSRFGPQGPGIGLGLPLAKAIVEAHHGTLTVESTLGRGSCFRINFVNPTKL